MVLCVADLHAMLEYLDELLEPARFIDFCPNGLQVPGQPAVTKVISGVSAGRTFIERAIEADGELLLVHHGLFWKGSPLALDLPAKRRLQLLFDADIALAAYHLPLDAHLEHGNNALLAVAIGCTTWAPLPTPGESPIGVLGVLPGEGISAAELVARTTAAVGGREPLAFTAGPERIRSVAIVSGGGSGYLGDAIAADADAFITGEPTERVVNQATESAIHYLAAGHYATETLGVRRLGELLCAKFGIEHEFIDVPNPI